MLNAQRLKEELVRNGMKQRDLADRVSVSEVSMSRYCSGTRTPRDPILVEIARVLNTTPEYLTGTEGLVHPDIAFAGARISVRTYGAQWTHEQKKELINAILDVMESEQNGNE